MVLATGALTSLLARSSSAAVAAAAAGGRARLPLLGFIGRPAASMSPAGQGRRALATTGMKSVADLRKEYSASGLEEAALPKDPFPLFRQWLEEAVGAQVRSVCQLYWTWHCGWGVGWIRTHVHAFM